MDNPWEHKWKILRPLSGGGQGDTFIVQQLDQSSQERVLKRLKPSKSQNLKARARMHREVTSLSTLASEGARVPRIYDGNTGDFEKLEIPLFFVMDYIEGRTLDRVIKENGVMTIDKGVALCLDVCETLRISITAGIAHRDIKPENLILRDLNGSGVVMLDFGLSFNKEDGSTWTETEESLDNKFVSLPERRGPFENKRDFRSDLTSVAAVLFYVLTGFPPRNLRNSDGKTPNRSQGVGFPKVADIRQLALLHAFFDRGLNNDIQTRFQTLDELEARLREIDNPSGTISRPDFHAEARNRIELLFRVDKVNRYTRYRATLKPFESALDKHMMVLAQRMEGFYVGWSSESDRHNEAEKREIVWFSELKIFVRGRQHHWRVIYEIKEEASECVLSRLLERPMPHEGFAAVGDKAVLFRYLPPAAPPPEVVIPDIETSILQAMDGFNKEIENPIPAEQPPKVEEPTSTFRKRRLPLGQKGLWIQGPTTAFAEDFGNLPLVQEEEPGSVVVEKFLPQKASDNPAIFSKSPEELVSDRPHNFVIPDGGKAYLKLYPTFAIAPIDTELEAREMATRGNLIPFGKVNSWGFDRNTFGAIVVGSAEDGNLYNFSQLFLSREIWGVDAASLNADWIRRWPAGETRPYIANGHIENCYINALTNYLAFAQNHLQLPLPVRIEAGLSGIKDYPISLNAAHISGKSLRDQIAWQTDVDSYEIPAWEILGPFFDRIWDNCGYQRTAQQQADVAKRFIR